MERGRQKQTGSPREAVFDVDFRRDLAWRIGNDRRIALKILELAEAVLADPSTGIGKPEPLRHELAGCWSRRITQEHRLIYLVSAQRITFLQARYHYE